MAVQAIVTDIETSSDEPFRKRFFPLEHLGPRFEPNQFFLGLFAPEFLGRFYGISVKAAVLRQRSKVGPLRKVLGRMEDTVLLQDGFDARAGFVCGHKGIIVLLRLIVGGGREASTSGCL